MPAIGAGYGSALGGAHATLSEAEVGEFVHSALDGVDLDGRSVCLVVPDATRSCPMPLLTRHLYDAVRGRARELTVLVALGTHAPMSETQLAVHLAGSPEDLAQTLPGLRAVNHEWWEPATFVSVGTIGAERVHELSEGRLDVSVDVRLNRLVVEHDVVVVVGPVFPHEVVGFSGGNKYFVPGVASHEVIDVSHWLGALISSRDIIGTLGTTPVRALIDEAASMIPSQRHALCLVVDGDDVRGLAFGPPETAWAACADISAECHLRRLDGPVSRVLSLVPTKYEDMWTAAKGFYKVEPVVADGGEVIIYAPHITEISRMHPEVAQVGYHCRDYFVKQWDRFSHLPWGVLAHSTHLRGAGTWTPEDGEHPRVKVTLATGIPEAAVRAVGLDHLDPADVDVEAFRRDDDTLVVDRAGEVLYRLS